MSLGPFEPNAPDLAPGDRAVLDGDWSAFALEAVRSAGEPAFDEAFRQLWDEFGARGEMERRDVIEERLAWNPARPVGGHALLYEMLVVRRGAEVVAVRDHTAIVTPAVLSGAAAPAVVVHLSHVLVAPSMRGHGLASWLRALPVASARRCLAQAPVASRPVARGRPDAPGITLVAEMEHDDGVTPAVVARLRSYAKAGFRVADPRRVRYSQPDFRSAAEIDRSGVRPVPLCLVLRRVGREHEASMRASELREVVAALHAMFAVHVRADHMEPVRAEAEGLPAGESQIALLEPGRKETGR